MPSVCSFVGSLGLKCLSASSYGGDGATKTFFAVTENKIGMTNLIRFVYITVVSFLYKKEREVKQVVGWLLADTPVLGMNHGH